MVGCLGNDHFGETLHAALQQEQIQTDALVKSTTAPTGIANILIYNNDNRIVVVPGANYDLSISHLEASKDLIQKSHLVMIQLEIPKETTAHAIQLCKEAGVPVLLNPAPAANFDVQWMEDITYLTPNETECAEIFNEPVEQVLEKYPNKLIVTLGSDGSRYFDGSYNSCAWLYDNSRGYNGGAGDTFNGGALAYALVEGQSLDEAVYFANIAASLSVEKLGAQGGMPLLGAVYARMAGLEE